MASDDKKQRETEQMAEKPKPDAVQAELRELRAQLEALQKSQAAESAARAAADREPSAPAPTPTPAVGSEEEAGPDEGVSVDLPAQLRELIEGVERDLRDARPATLVAVFALGVLVGRLVSR
jgi:hypothetical protein